MISPPKLSALKGVYKAAEEKAQLKAKAEGRLLKGLFFQTKNSYPLHSRSNNGTSVAPRVKQPFFYSVVCKDEQ